MAAPKSSKSSESSAHYFEEIVEQAKTTCDKEYRRHYSAKKTITKVYKHPQGIEFIHTHEDGRDYEDSYRYETVQIGAIRIKYSYDWGNYFVMEDVYLYVNDKQIAVASQSQGAVDPYESNVENKADGQKILKRVAKPFGMTMEQFIKECSSTFNINGQCFGLFTECL